MLSCLNKLRHPIDDALRKTANKSEKNKERNQGSGSGRKSVKSVKTNADDKGGARQKKEADGQASGNKDNGNPSSKEVKAVKNTPRRDSNKTDTKKKDSGSSNDSMCKLCGKNNHQADNCDTYPDGQCMIGRFPCRNCGGKLFKAAQRFDETRGFKFISYAVWWIRQSILQALAEQSRIVRLPLNKVGSLNKINKAFSELEQAFEREPSPEELATMLEIPTEEVETTLGVAARHVSMDAPFITGEDNSLLDVLENGGTPGTDTALEYTDSLRREIERSLSTLTDRQCDVIKLYFGIGIEHPMSLEDIGDKFGLTRERVRQIKDKAINKLRSQNRSKLLKNYLGA